MNLIRNELGLARANRRFPRKETLASIHSRAANAHESLSSVLEREYPWCADDIEGIRRIFTSYARRKRRQNVVDYDDLLVLWRELATHPALGPRVASMFDHILVDEYQDTNIVQAEILSAMRPPGTNLTVVGDDAQAIYGFRSATVRNILEFEQRFPNATVLRLEQNYRSTPPILAASNAVIALAARRHEKTLWSARSETTKPRLSTCRDDAEQCEIVCGTVLEHRERGIQLKDQAVLFRAAHHSGQLEMELARRNIPFVKYGGLRFLEAAHVKDVLALLRILENPLDEISWFRVLLLLDGVGPATAERMMRSAGVRGDAGAEARSPLGRLLDAAPAIPAEAAAEFDELRSALADCSDERRGLDAWPPGAQIERLRPFCEAVFRRRYDAADARLRDLDQLANVARRHGTRGRFLAELALDPPSSTSDLAGPPSLDDDYLVLSTMHSAKGLEWKVVFVLHAADGMIPSDMSTGDAERIEEERRLLYVAMTRARDQLVILFPQSFYRRPKGLDDAHTYAQLSRFLQPDTVRAQFTEGAAISPIPS
jgi:ATP-dependent DNA helicase UvrD/PcrA